MKKLMVLASLLTLSFFNVQPVFGQLDTFPHPQAEAAVKMRLLDLKAIEIAQCSVSDNVIQVGKPETFNVESMTQTEHGGLRAITSNGAIEMYIQCERSQLDHFTSVTFWFGDTSYYEVTFDTHTILTNAGAPRSFEPNSEKMFWLDLPVIFDEVDESGYQMVPLDLSVETDAVMYKVLAQSVIEIENSQVWANVDSLTTAWVKGSLDFQIWLTLEEGFGVAEIKEALAKKGSVIGQAYQAYNKTHFKQISEDKFLLGGRIDFTEVEQMIQPESFGAKLKFSTNGLVIEK